MHSRNVLLVLGLALSPLSCPSWAAGAVAGNSTAAEQTAAPSESNKEALPEPFKLTSGQQAEVARVLKRWEQWNARIKTFDCRFTRWIYDPVFSACRPAPVRRIGRHPLRTAGAHRVLGRSMRERRNNERGRRQSGGAMAL